MIRLKPILLPALGAVLALVLTGCPHRGHYDDHHPPPPDHHDNDHHDNDHHDNNSH